MVAGAEGAQLQPPVGGVAVGVDTGALRPLLQLGDPRSRVWSRVTSVLYRPAESGTASSMATRTAAPVGREVAAVNWVRTAIIPQPMSTPTAAGMTAPSVGMTLPTVAPLPRWASGMSARCG